MAVAFSFIAYECGNMIELGSSNEWSGSALTLPTVPPKGLASMDHQSTSINWRKHPVTCSQCGTRIMRRLYRPKDSKRIRHFFCDNVCKGAWQAAQKGVSADWLRQKYWEEDLGCPQIAKLVNRDPKTVLNWLRYYGIPTRTRGHDTSHLPNGREPGFTLSIEHREALRQARLRDGHVPYLQNGVHWLKGKTGNQHPSWKGGLTPERQAFYATDEWKAAVVEVWQRADAHCERCGLYHNSVRGEVQFHIHHIVSFAVRELRSEVSNLALLCEECHRFVHSKANIDQELIGDFNAGS